MYLLLSRAKSDTCFVSSTKGDVLDTSGVRATSIGHSMSPPVHMANIPKNAFLYYLPIHLHTICNLNLIISTVYK